MTKNLKFEASCGMKFEVPLDVESNWEGRIIVTRKMCSKEDSEKYKESEISSDKCVSCSLEHKTSERLCTLFKDRVLVGCVDTYCLANLVDSPYPKICPLSGDTFFQLAYDYSTEDIVPVYISKEGKMRTNFTFDSSMSDDRYGVSLMYREVHRIDEDNAIECESGVSMYYNVGEKFHKILSEVLESTFINPKEGTTLDDKKKFLKTTFDSLNFEY